jgi:Alpha-L-rhamnosidase N-terminal domain./Bacterial alpha-L-rhamnosidase.
VNPETGYPQNKYIMRDTAAIFSRSRWIWPDSHHWDLHNGYALFRRAFTLETGPVRAPLFITADQSYRLHVNGNFVGRGPARGYQSAWPYDEIDIAAWLRPGANLIAIRAYNPGFSNFQYVTQGFAGLLLAARWGDFELVSDASWRAVRQRSTKRDTIPASLQLFPQEHVDLRLEDPGDWCADPAFDDSTWKPPVERPWNSGPWFSLQPRGIPLLDEKRVEPLRLLGLGEGRSAPGYPQVRDVTALHFQEARGHLPAPGVSFKPLHVRPAGRGMFRSHLLDFGRVVVGNLVLEVAGAVGGEMVDCHFAESIDSTSLSLDHIDSAHSSRMAFGGRLICRAGDQCHRFYHPYGFRYLALLVRDTTREIRVSVSLDWIGYPLKRAGAFSCSEPDLERIWEACAWTQQCCSLDAYVDTPWREQAQWWGDARVQAWNTFFLSGDARLLRRGIAQIAGQTTPDGLTYGHAPTMAHNCILPDFTLVWLITLWDYYWQTGSTEPLVAHHETVRRALGYFRAHTDARTGLVTHDERFWLFLDWSDLHKTGTPTVLNLWLVIALDKLAELHREIGRSDEASSLSAWAERLRDALSRLVTPEGLLCDGLDRNNLPVNECSIHAQVLGAAARIPKLNTERAGQTLLVPFVRGELQPAASPSAYWITYVFSALADLGHGADVIAYIRRRWKPMADYGTTWENFEPKRADESLSHAWSAHPLYHFAQILGGINQSAPAWREIIWRPVFVGDFARVIVPTPHGNIVSAWHRKPDGIHLRLELPVGVDARIALPGRQTEVVTGGYRTVLEADKVP